MIQQLPRAAGYQKVKFAGLFSVLSLSFPVAFKRDDLRYIATSKTRLIEMMEKTRFFSVYSSFPPVFNSRMRLLLLRCAVMLLWAMLCCACYALM